MPVRKVRGRTRVVSARSDERGRAALAPVERRLSPTSTVQAGVTRLVLALVSLWALPEGDRAARRLAQRRVADVRRRLAAMTTSADAWRVQKALAGDDGLLRAAARAPEDSRRHLIQAAAQHAAIGAENGLSSTAAVSMLGRAAAWAGLASSLLAEGMRTTGAERSEALKLARYAGQSARLDLLGSLEVEARTRDAEPLEAPMTAAEVRAHLDELDRQQRTRAEAQEFERDDEPDDGEGEGAQ